MRSRTLVAGAAWVALLAASADAQGFRPSTSPPRHPTDSIPVAYRPPPGMCRIWIDGVPPSQQPAPSDCTTAVRMRPRNARVIYGDDFVDRSRRPSRQGDADTLDDDRRDPRSPNAPMDPRDIRGQIDPRFLTPGAPDVGFGPGIRPEDICLDLNHDGICDNNGRTGSTCVDRYAAGRCDNFPREARTCVDLNRDGRCDDVSRDADTCVDNNLDGYCDNAADRRLPSDLPPMIDAVEFTRGSRSYAVQRWLGDGDLTARIVDADRDGVPDRVTWFDPSGQVVQIWTDRDHDGRADRVEIYSGGKRVRVIGQ